MEMQRNVERELLDELPETDARAKGSRRDLRRLNWLMGNVQSLAGQLQRLPAASPERTILDLGAGDGDVMRKVAERLGRGWRGSRAILLDKQVPGSDMRGAFSRIGWLADFCRADVTRVAEWPETEELTAVVANLFLHHFAEEQLKELFEAAAKRAACFIAVEPQRTRLALLASRLIAFIGCNEVTRHDAPVSVRAGFEGHELSALWPSGEGWTCFETRAGLFSHLFVARKSPAR